MANLFGAILSGLKKKKDEEDQIAVAPVKATPMPATAPVPSPQLKTPSLNLSSVGSAIQNAWNNYWKPTQDVRARDYVREIPGAWLDVNKKIGKTALNIGREIVTRPAARTVLSIADKANQNFPESSRKYPTTLEVNDPLGRVLFGNETLKSYQQSARDASNWTKETFNAPENVANTTGILLGTVNAALDLPGGSEARAASKELVEKVGKEALEKTGKEAVEVAVKKADELAPLLQELEPAARTTVDDAIAALKEKGYVVAESLINKLKSGKVIDGEGFVLQSNKNGFIANFDKALKNLLGKEPVEETATKATKEVLQDATKGVDDVTKTAVKTGEELIQEGEQTGIKKAIGQADESITAPAKPPAPAGSEAATATPEEYITSRPIFDNLSQEQKDVVTANLRESGFEKKLTDLKGSPLTQDEVVEEAVKIQDGLKNPVTREQTKTTAAQLQNTQNTIAQLSVEYDQAIKSGDMALAQEIDAKLADELLKQRSVAANWGRIGNVLQNPGDLNMPAGQKILGKILGRVDEAKIDEVINAWKNMSPEDKLNPEAIRDFYFSFIEPTTKEILDEFKYINLLSSPLTQIRNIAGNIDAVVVEPATQLVRGVLDRLFTSTRLQKERKTFAREAVDMVTGMMGSIPKAWDDAKAVFNRQAIGDNLDLARIPVGKYADRAAIFSKEGPLLKARQLAGKATGIFLEKGGKVNDAMQAGDRFFKSIIEAGFNKAKTATADKLGVELTGDAAKTLAKDAKDKGLELTFQSELKPGSHAEGYLNQVVDVVANGLMQARNAPGIVGGAASTVFPFIGVAANVLKRYISYLPGIGALNAVGVDNAYVKEVAARQITGIVGLAASLWAVGRLAQEDRIAGAAPNDPAGKANFLSAHPEYSVNLTGDTWIQTSRMGVFGKLVETAIRYYEGRYHENDLTDSQAADMFQALTGAALDMSDESYLSNLGLLIDSFKNDGAGSYARKQFAATPVRQNIPLVGFQGWLAKLIDPTNRKSEDSDGGYFSNAFAGINKNLPFLSFNYDPYLNPDNTPSVASRWNSVTPFKVQESNPAFEQNWSFDRFGRQIGSAERRFSSGEINYEDFMQSLNNASAYFSGTQPEKVDLGDAGDVTLPTKQDIAQLMTQPKGVQLSNLRTTITGSQPVKLSGGVKAKVSSPPRVSAIKLGKLRLPTAPKSASKKVSGVSLASAIKPPTPPQKKVGEKQLAEIEARKRKSSGVYLS